MNLPVPLDNFHHHMVIVHSLSVPELSSTSKYTLS